MKYRVEISKPALEQLSDVRDMRVRKKLFERIEQLAQDPTAQGKPLKDELAGLHSVRAIGQRYRIIYQIEDEQVLVLAVAVGLRRKGDRADIYRTAARLLQSGAIHPQSM